MTGLGIFFALAVSAAAIDGLILPAIRGKVATKEQRAAVEELAAAMDRSDADGVFAHVDPDAIFRVFLRHSLEIVAKKPFADAEFEGYLKTNPLILVQTRQAVLHGVLNEEDKKGATPGSLMYILVHIREGKIVSQKDGTFSVVLADGSSLRFAQREGQGWVAVRLEGIDKYFDEYRQKAQSLARDRMLDGYKGTPSEDAEDKAGQEGTETVRFEVVQ